MFVTNCDYAHTSNVLEVFNHSSIFNNAVFCLGEKQAMLINDECSSWYNRVCQFGIGGLKFYMAVDQ